MLVARRLARLIRRKFLTMQSPIWTGPYMDYPKKIMHSSRLLLTP